MYNAIINSTNEVPFMTSSVTYHMRGSELARLPIPTQTELTKEMETGVALGKPN